MTKNLNPNNRILALLPLKDYQHLLPALEDFELIFGKTIYEPGERISHIYFPESGIVSLLSSVAEKATIEVGIVGSEGMIGLPVFLGVETSNNLAIVQGAGTAQRIKTADFLAECKNGGELPRLLQRFTHSLLTQISQSAACNRFHQIEARLARWLLMTHDRMRNDKFRITQEFLSNMIGVRREAVNKAATHFQQQQLISYSRGNLSILNRAELEKAACQCYRIIKAEADIL